MSDCEGDPFAVDGGWELPLEVTGRCFYLAWQANDRELAATYADPPAVESLFEYPWHDGWSFVGCERNEARAAVTWLGVVCSLREEAPPGELHGVLAELYFVAYDDVAVVGEVEYFG